VYVSALSLWALVSGHWSAWQAARVEVNQAAEMKAHAKEDLAAAHEELDALNAELEEKIARMRVT
jgi:type VI protein secretion system component VasK